jgi:hypothetical protein
MKSNLIPKAVLLLTAGSVFLSASNTSYACKCKFPTVAEAFTKADAVFSGRVVAIETEGVRFKVKRIWKGVKSPEIKVYVKLLGTSCDPGIRKGREFIVYAYSGTERLPLMASYCGRTQPLKFAADDVKELNRAPSVNQREAQQALGADSP